MIHQQFLLTPRLSVLDNVLGGTLPMVNTWRVLARAWPRSLQRRACQLLEQVGLGEEHLYRRASQLSGGQQQRVAIARAFILKPDLVLADEPVASLDPAISRGIMDLLKRESRRERATVLCSLHQVEFAVEFADRVVGLRAGRTVFDGTPTQLTDEVLAEIYDENAVARRAAMDGSLAGVEVSPELCERQAF
jgi:phosphonate transport system ATP-binding protein